jgi:hypothetical protein
VPPRSIEPPLVLGACAVHVMEDCVVVAIVVHIQELVLCPCCALQGQKVY